MSKKNIILSLVLIVSIIILLLSKDYLKTKNNTTKNKTYNNLIMVAFDGLQAKHLSAYGYKLNSTPNLDKFFDKSYLFTKTVSPSSWTVPTYMSIFTSMYPSEHKLVNKFVEYDKSTNKIVQSNIKNLNPNITTIASIMKSNGYITAGFTGDAGINSAFGYNQGFDEYFDKEVFGGFPTSVTKAIDWLKINKYKKFFLFVQGYDVHGQFQPAGGFDYRYVEKNYKGKYTGSPIEQGVLREAGLANNLSLDQNDIYFWRAIYDEKIARADIEFGKLLDEVNKNGLTDNTLIVVFSDHGTEFYEHNKFDHGHTLYGELVNVLMAIKTPGQEQGKKIDSLVSTLDIVPTVLKLLNIQNPVPEQTKGIDLTPSFKGEEISRNIFSETDYRLYTHKRSIQTPDGWKFILTMNGPERELYNLNIDSDEQNNLASLEPKKAYELEQLIYKHLNEMNSNGPWPLGCLPVYNDQCQTVGNK